MRDFIGPMILGCSYPEAVGIVNLLYQLAVDEGDMKWSCDRDARKEREAYESQERGKWIATLVCPDGCEFMDIEFYYHGTPKPSLFYGFMYVPRTDVIAPAGWMLKVRESYE